VPELMISALALRTQASTNLRLAEPNFDLAAVNVAGAAENWPFFIARNMLCSSKLSERLEVPLAVSERIHRFFNGGQRVLNGNER